MELEEEWGLHKDSLQCLYILGLEKALVKPTRFLLASSQSHGQCGEVCQCPVINQEGEKVSV